MAGEIRQKEEKKSSTRPRKEEHVDKSTAGRCVADGEKDTGQPALIHEEGPSQ